MNKLKKFSKEVEPVKSSPGDVVDVPAVLAPNPSEFSQRLLTQAQKMIDEWQRRRNLIN